MKKVINGCIYAIDLGGTEEYEFKGVHPAMVVRMLKEEKMYYVVPLTTYTKERWEKCKRQGFGCRIVSTNSIARVDKINIVTEKQIHSRYYNSEKLVCAEPAEIEKVILRVEEYFKLQLGRPEILNRIGENIVVFDFIRQEVAEEILRAQVNKIITNLQTEKKITLSLSDEAMKTLRTKATENLDNGGRGIGNIVESLLINPLSRYLFDHEIFEDRTVIIDEMNAEIQPYSLNCTVL